MLTPAKARQSLQRHFGDVSPEDFASNVRDFCPDATDTAFAVTPTGHRGDVSVGPIVLSQPAPVRLPLEAYLACALSNLSTEQRQLMFTLSDVVRVVCNEAGINLYEPRKKTDPVHHADIQDSVVFSLDRQRVLSSDLVIHLCHYP